MKTNQKSKKSGCFTYAFVLFGIPFALVGIFLGIKSIGNFSDAHKMRKWEKVPAKIISVKLNENRSDKSTTYSIDTAYQYKISGKVYTGSRVNITGGGESGSYYPALYKKMKRYKNKGENYFCFVNPEKPCESILNNKLRTVDIIIFPAVAILFSGIGIGVIVFGIINIKKAKILVGLEQKYPDKPWMQKPDWLSGKIKSSNKTMVYFSLFFALFWNLISWPVVIAFIPEILKEKNHALMFIFLFPAVGIVLIIWFVFSLIRWKKFGESVFIMKSVPGVVGGALKGLIITNVNIKPDSGFKIELNCVNKHTSGSGKNRRTSERILWQDVRFIKREAMENDLTKSAIPVLFKIPFDARETNEENSNDKIIWRVKISAEVPGVDYSAHFEVPVFKTEESREDFELDDSSLDKYVEKPGGDSLLKSSGIISEELMNGGVRFIFPIAWKSAVVIFAVIIFWGAVVLFLWTKKNAPMMLKIIFSAVLPFLIYRFFDLLLYKSEITIQNNSVSILNGWLGFRSVKDLTSSDVSEIKIEKSSQSGKTLFYSIAAITKLDKKVVIAKRINNLQHAEYIINEIKKVIKLTRLVKR